MELPVKRQDRLSSNHCPDKCIIPEKGWKRYMISYEYKTGHPDLTQGGEVSEEVLPKEGTSKN